MFSKLFKKKSNIKADDPVQRLPERFSFMPQEEQLHFQDDITKFFQDKYPTFIINFSEGFIKGSDGTEYGLDNVAQNYYHAVKYSQVSDKEKTEIIANHFNGIFEGKKKEKEILKDIESFDKVKKYLTVRLYPPDYIEQIKDKAIYREDIEGILTTLVFDLPTTVAFVKPEQASVWKVNKDELFEAGFKNTFANNQIELTQHIIAKESILWMIGSDGLFAGTFVYNLSKYKQVIGKYGSIISLPHRHSLILLPIQNKSILSALNQFMTIANGMYQEGPGSISPNIYWYHEDRLTKLPYKLDNKKLEFYPPKEFIDVLNKVAEKE